MNSEEAKDILQLCRPDHVEGTQQIDLHPAGEPLDGHLATLAHDLHGTTEAGAVDNRADRSKRPLGFLGHLFGRLGLDHVQR